MRFTRFSWTLSSMCFGTVRRRTSIYSHTFSSDCWFKLLMATSVSLGAYRSLWWGTLASSQTGFLATLICVFNYRCIKLNMHLPVIDISVTSRISYASCYASEIKNWKLRRNRTRLHFDRSSPNLEIAISIFDASLIIHAIISEIYAF